MSPDQKQVFFKLSDLSEILGVEASVLRYWEKEFSQIKPMKVGPRKRLYRPKDLDTFQEIKRLLYSERFTIAGAKKQLEEAVHNQELPLSGGSGDAAQSGEHGGETVNELRAARRTIDKIRQDLIELKKMVSRPLNLRKEDD